MATITTTQTTEIKITPALKKKLLVKLKSYAANKQAMDALKHANDKLKNEIESLFVTAGEFDALQAGVKVDGFSTKHVSPLVSRLNKKLLLEQGVTTAMLEMATETTPGKSYTKITVPGERDGE